MSLPSELNPVDQAVLSNLEKHGKKIKKYELSYLVKRDVACSDLDLTNSLKKLQNSDLILKSGKSEFLLKI